VRLGLAADTYRWIAYPWMRADRSAFRSTSHYAPHILSVDPPKPASDLPDWLLDRVHGHGLSALAMDVGLLEDRAGASSFGARCADSGVQILGSVSVNLLARPDRWGQAASEGSTARFDPSRASTLQSGWIGNSEASIAATAIRLAADAGAPILSLVHGQPDRINRYSPDPGLADQLQRIESNVRTLLPLAAEMGITLALEPHMDYRCAELVRVIEAIASPHLRLVLDVASPLAVNEDPLDAARRSAPYVVATHLRDMRVQALTEVATGALFHTPIGEGHVPVDRILETLNNRSADPGSVIHCLKIVTRPEHDIEAWLGASLATVRDYASLDTSRGAA